MEVNRRIGLLTIFIQICELFGLLLNPASVKIKRLDLTERHFN